ncbi:MAG: Regulatory sensor-transducer, BlaR1/MecR1 family, partial [Pedosphaera sp.]|nr:Regulatory sensor-transducer, BlaR1/MecR1 family [Pedosphaera sp.]
AKKFAAAQQEAMLAHELAHLAGNDAAWYLLADLLTAALWWHPLVWRARHQLHAASELAADEASLLVADGPSVLAECLVEIGTRLTQRRAFRQMGVEGNGFRSGLGQRVERLVNLEGETWRPPNHIRCGLARVLGPTLLVTATILCTAWVVPPALTKGENMKSITQYWKQPLTTLALLASINSTTIPVQAGLTAPEAVPAVAAAAPVPTAPEAPLVAAPTSLAPTPPPAPALPTGLAPVPMAAALPESRMPVAVSRNLNANAQYLTKEGQALESKLYNIKVDAVQYDGLPLSEVINNLTEIAAARDPDKTGINFVLNREKPEVGGAVDPATGLPTASAFDLAAVTVTIRPQLKHVRLIDVLEVITKCADQPIKYSIENYGVMFSVDPTRTVTAQSPVAVATAPTASAVEALEVRAYKVDTNTFFQGLERAFGIGIDNKNPDVRAGLMNLAHAIGVDLDTKPGMPRKSIFYNDVTGMIMMRATKQDLEAMAAAVETLGGNAGAGAASSAGKRPTGF